MTSRNISKIADALTVLLEREHQAARSRNYKFLASLNVRKGNLVDAIERALSEISGTNDTALIEALAGLTEKAKRNAELLAAIRQGYHDARRRIEAISQAERQSGFYGAGGCRIANVRSAVAKPSV